MIDQESWKEKYLNTIPVLPPILERKNFEVFSRQNSRKGNAEKRKCQNSMEREAKKLQKNSAQRGGGVL